MVNTVAKNIKLNNNRNNAIASQLNTKLRSAVKYKNNISICKTAPKSSKTKLSVSSCNKRTALQSNPTTKKSNKKEIYLPKPDVLHTYLSYSEIIQYFNYLKYHYTDHVTIHVLGYSYENRAIKGIEINWNCKRMLKAWERKQDKQSQFSIQNNPTKPSKPAERNMIFIEGGTHAREWLSISVALYCIYQLTENYVCNSDLLEKLRFFIVPLVNPDGYEYSRKTNPRWRKNRRPHTLDKYIGTDCNRNFDFHWKKCGTLSKLNTYQGEKPFSEPETRALASMLRKLQPKLLLFLSLHSYGQCIMYPWGYTNTEPENIEMLYEVAKVARKSIKSFSGRYYQIGSIAQLTRRNIAGSVVDYAYGVVNVPLAFVMELPSKEYGFQPPLKFICPLSRESWFGIRDMCKHAVTLKGNFEKECRKHGTTELNILNDDMPPSSTQILLKQFDNLKAYIDNKYCTESAISSPLSTLNRSPILHLDGILRLN